MFFNKTYTPAAANLTGYKSNATGASWPLTTTNSSDDLAHLVTVRNDSVTDHSGKTALLTGTDADNNVQTETLTLPGTSATVTSTKYFRTLTTVVPSATIGADTMDIGWAAGAVGQSIGLEKYSAATAAISTAVTGTINFDVEETPENFHNNPTQNGIWSNISALAAKTANTVGSSTQSMQAVRIAVNTVTATATVRITVAQAITT